jgi:hypothetical protein
MYRGMWLAFAPSRAEALTRMGLYNFKAQFVPFILDGRKTHTIRAMRKRPARRGETLHLYTGLRRKGARLLMRVACAGVQKISIGMGWRDGSVGGRIWIDGQELSLSECGDLAVRDGFASFAAMMEFWEENHSLPFHGEIIHWGKA